MYGYLYWRNDVWRESLKTECKTIIALLLWLSSTTLVFLCPYAVISSSPSSKVVSRKSGALFIP